MRILLRAAKVLLVLVGLVAILHVVCLLCQRPLVRLVEVEGISMQPTFEPGDRLLFVRRHFQPDSIVIADAGEDGRVIKLRSVRRCCYSSDCGGAISWGLMFLRLRIFSATSGGICLSG